MNIQDIPVPPNTYENIPEGSFEVKIDLITSLILNSLKEDHSKVEDKLLLLPIDEKWADIEEFYNTYLLQNGFEKESSKHFERKDYYLAIWKRKGFLKNESVAIAFVNTGKDKDNKPLKFLNIFIAN